MNNDQQHFLVQWLFMIVCFALLLEFIPIVSVSSLFCYFALSVLAPLEFLLLGVKSLSKQKKFLTS